MKSLGSLGNIKVFEGIFVKLDIFYHVSTTLFSMAQSPNQMTSFCEDGNKLDGATNIQAWKKIIDLILVENEVIEHDQGKFEKL